ncbi:MAG: hypothetical protein ABI986_02540 [Chloroflexota bacterium]
MTTFDLNILPIHRNNGQDSPDLPGLLAVTAPRKTARGREKDNLIIYLMLSGNATFSTAELNQLNNKTANLFYQTAGSLTSAMRKASENINSVLLERNLATTGRGQYALGLLALAVIRDAQDAQCTLLLSGPTHAVWVTEGQSRHIYDAALSGKGLGSSQNIQTYLSQVDLHTNDLLVLCGKFPKDWEADLLGERPPASLEASYRKLTFTKGDLNAALIQPQVGSGVITVLRAQITMPRPSQPVPASVPQTVAASESISSPAVEAPYNMDLHGFENILSESPENQHAELGQPQIEDHPSDTSEIIDSTNPESHPTTITEEELDELADFAAHMLQPSGYAIPPQPEGLLPSFPTIETPTPATTNTISTPRNFPPSIPRITPVETKIEPFIEAKPEEEPEEEIDTETEEAVSVTSLLDAKPQKPDAHVIATRQMAKVMVGGIQIGRRTSESIRAFLQRFIPRLLPGAESANAEHPQQQQMFFMPTYAMVFIAIVIPAVVVTIASVVYLRFGQSVQYDEYYSQALNARAQAISETDPARQRDAWLSVIASVKRAEDYRQTNESNSLHTEAQANLDNLMGVVRLEFVPAFANGIGGATRVSRLAASESDLYMLDAERGSILHAAFTGRSLEIDNAFNCQPGTYAGYQVDTLVDVLALPKINAAGATVLGIDSNGYLLYCAPGQVPQAIPLPSLPNTNWGHITAFALDSGNLYVLDSTSRAVWVFPGKDSAFVDTPYFYFGNQIPANIDRAIDLGVSGNDLYMLHADGHISTCTFSRIQETPTRCTDPVIYQDSFPADQGINVFAQAHFTQLSLTNPPNAVVLLLDSQNQSVFRFSPRSLELQNQISSHAGKGNPFKSGPVDAMTVSPNYVLYLAIGNQVYFATNLP